MQNPGENIDICFWDIVGAPLTNHLGQKQTISKTRPASALIYINILPNKLLVHLYFRWVGAGLRDY